jgi:hypothetical protein
VTAPAAAPPDLAPAAAASAETDAKVAAVARLMTILGGDTPVEAGAELIHPDVVANFDGWRFQGINLWAGYIRYLRCRPGISQLRLVMERIQANPDGTVTAAGRWHALRRGVHAVSNLGVATYRFEGGKIVEIWTTRRNYLLLFGPWLKYRWGLAWMLFRLGRWQDRVPQLDLRAAAVAHLPAAPPAAAAEGAPETAPACPVPPSRGLVARINGPLHRPVMWAFLAVVLAHWAEHLVQAYQVWALHMPRHHALGVLGMVWPWLVHSEWMHYGYALVMLAGLVALWPGMVGRARAWWGVALALQFWHHLEHGLLLGQALTGWRLGGGAAPASLLQLVVPRVELHLFYNSIVFVPMVIGMLYHAFPSREEAARAACSCGHGRRRVRPPGAAALPGAA